MSRTKRLYSFRLLKTLNITTLNQFLSWFCGDGRHGPLFSDSVHFVIQPRNLLNSELISLTVDPIEKAFKITMHNSPHEERIAQITIDRDLGKEFQILESNPYNKPTTKAVSLLAKLSKEASNGLHPYSNSISVAEITLPFTRPFKLHLPNSGMMTDFSIKNDNGILSIHDSENRSVEVINHGSCPAITEERPIPTESETPQAPAKSVWTVWQALREKTGF